MTNSERRLERVLDVLDRGLPGGRPDDGDDVEPRRRHRGRVAAEVELPRLAELVHLVRVDLLLRRRGVVVGAALDLDEDQELLVARDEVDLPDRRREVAREDAEPLALQERRRRVLTLAAEPRLLLGLGFLGRLVRQLVRRIRVPAARLGGPAAEEVLNP